MEMTALGPFTGRLAGRLSGGMKQKLGLACTLVRSPELLLLDEPTVGVDPLSRRELWEIIVHLVRRAGPDGAVSTSYLDEAERCGHVIVLHEGKVLAQGRPRSVTPLADGPQSSCSIRRRATTRARSAGASCSIDPDVIDAVPEGGRVRLVVRAAADARGSAEVRRTRADLAARRSPPRFEDGFMVLLRRSAPVTKPGGRPSSCSGHCPRRADEAVVEVQRPGQALRRLHRRRSRQLRGAARARSSVCWAPTARARPRPSACSAACCRRPAAR